MTQSPGGIQRDAMLHSVQSASESERVHSFVDGVVKPARARSTDASTSWALWGEPASSTSVRRAQLVQRSTPMFWVAPRSDLILPFAPSPQDRHMRTGLPVEQPAHRPRFFHADLSRTQMSAQRSTHPQPSRTLPRHRRAGRL
jgi:hypothetical protein